MNKQILIGLLLLSLKATASTYIPCSEDETESCWPCGETCAVRLTYANEQDAQNKTNGTLTFSGTGSTGEYKSKHENPDLIGVAPWYKVRKSVSKVVVEEGITRLGDRTIYAAPNVREVILPESLESIGYYTFHNTNIETLVIPQNVSNLARGAIGYAGTETVYCPQSIQAQCETAIQDGTISSPVKALISYETTKDGQYFYNGKWYNSAKDIVSGNHIKKLRYTVEEAMKATEHGDKFHVYLTYK